MAHYTSTDPVRKDLPYLIIKYSCFVVGMAILAFGLYNIHARCEVTEGGVLGAVLLIEHWTHLSPAVSSIFLDAACFLFGTFVLGRSFLRDSIITALLFSGWYALFEWTGPLFWDLSASPLAASILGALFVGVGVGLTVIFGGACGGDDALALAFHHLVGVPYAVVYLITDVTVLVLSLSYIPLQKILWSLLSVNISSAVISLVSWTYDKIEKRIAKTHSLDFHPE